MLNVLLKNAININRMTKKDDDKGSAGSWAGIIFHSLFLFTGSTWWLSNDGFKLVQDPDMIIVLKRNTLHFVSDLHVWLGGLKSIVTSA